jgi:hypothetical protein
MNGPAHDPTGPSAVGRYARRTGVIETDLGAELILLDPATQEMFSLNDVGRLIWRSLDEEPVDAIVDRVVGSFDVDHDTAGADVCALLRQLLDAGLAHAAG